MEQDSYDFKDLTPLGSLFHDIVPESLTSKHDAILRLSFHSDFNEVLGLYLALDKAAERSVRWYLLLPFVISHCNSHYMAWTHRRQAITDKKFLIYCIGELENHSDLYSALPCELLQWIPSREKILFPFARSLSTKDLLPEHISTWRSVLWELQMMQHFTCETFKGFQFFHHRRELLQYALDNCSLLNEQRSLIESEEGFRSFLSAQDLSYDDFQEMELMNEVFHLDSKNYHCWAYRTWMLTSFPFLRSISMVDLSGLANSFLKGHLPINSSLLSSPSGLIEFKYPYSPIDDPAWHYLPECPLRSELLFTGENITKDWYNNSAWCHREYIITRFLLNIIKIESISNYQKSFSTSHSDLASSIPPLEWGRQCLQAVCQSEIDFAFHWICVDISNESPLSFAIQMVEYFRESFILFELCQLNLISDLDSFLTGGMSVGNTISSDKTTICSITDSIWSRFLLKSQTPLKQYLSFSIFEQSNSLFFYFQKGLRQVQQKVEPIFRNELLARQQVEEASVSGDKLAHQTYPPILQSEANRPTYFDSNILQVESAIVHSYLNYLVNLWFFWIDTEERQSWKVIGRYQAFEKESSKSQVQDSESISSFYSALQNAEERVLDLLPELYTFNRIRSKYWRRIAYIVLYRDYIK